jgi:hypothetical protein
VRERLSLGRYMIDRARVQTQAHEIDFDCRLNRPVAGTLDLIVGVTTGRAPSSCSMLVRGISKRIQVICSVWGAAVPFHATTPLHSMCEDVQHDLCRYTVTQEIAIREDADSPHARPTLRAALEASAPQHMHGSEVARVRY